MYVSAYEVVSESLQTYTITLHWFLSENGSKSFNMMLNNSWKLWLYYINFQKPLDVGASVCAKTITFFAIQNCGKIIMLFDDQLHLGSVTVWILSIVWYMSEKLFSTSFLSFWPWKEKSKPRPFKSQALNRRNSFFSSLLLSKIAPLYYRFWLVRNRKKNPTLFPSICL